MNLWRSDTRTVSSSSVADTFYAVGTSVVPSICRQSVLTLRIKAKSLFKQSCFSGCQNIVTVLAVLHRFAWHWKITSKTTTSSRAKIQPQVCWTCVVVWIRRARIARYPVLQLDVRVTCYKRHANSITLVARARRFSLYRPGSILVRRMLLAIVTHTLFPVRLFTKESNYNYGFAKNLSLVAASSTPSESRSAGTPAASRNTWSERSLWRPWSYRCAFIVFRACISIRDEFDHYTRLSHLLETTVPTRSCTRSFHQQHGASSVLLRREKYEC